MKNWCESLSCCGRRRGYYLSGTLPVNASWRDCMWRIAIFNEYRSNINFRRTLCLPHDGSRIHTCSRFICCSRCAWKNFAQLRTRFVRGVSKVAPRRFSIGNTTRTYSVPSTRSKNAFIHTYRFELCIAVWTHLQQTNISIFLLDGTIQSKYIF